jgi:hypothetical protein
MSDVTSVDPSSTEPQAVSVSIGDKPSLAAAPVVDVPPAAVDPAPIDPATPYVPTPVTHESLLTEFVEAVKRDARGISRDIESLLEKAAHHFGL